MRLVAVLVLPCVLALLASSSLLRGDEKAFPETPYYPLDVGNKWEYKVIVGSNDKDRYVSRVAKHAALPDPTKDVDCAWVETLSDGNVIGVEYLAVKPDGLYRYGFNKEMADKPMLVLKLPPKAGDTWPVDLKIKDQSLQGTFKTVGETKVKVAAGEYKAWHVEGKDLDINGIKGSISLYFAENVGIVKYGVQIGTMKTDFELEKFTPAKKE